MAIYKAKVETEYAVIPNAALQDKSLSYEATGLLAMMLSLPDDWEIHKSWLQEQKQKCGRDKLTRMMAELVEAGYVRKQVKQGDAGKFDGVDWLVFPTAQLKNRTTEKPSDGKPDTTKETDLQSKHNYKHMVHPADKPPVKKDYAEEFEWIWSNKPDREGANPKRKAYQACNARIKQGATWREMAEGMNRYKAYCQQTKIIGTRVVQQMATFFGPDEHFKNEWKINDNPKTGQSSQNNQQQSVRYVQQDQEKARQELENL